MATLAISPSNGPGFPKIGEPEKRPYIKRELITPEKARQYLAMGREYDVRPSQGTVEMYARDMAAGQWRPDVAPICFDWNSVRLDGQHRLLAVIRFGQPVWMDVKRDMDPADWPFFDKGRKRGFGVTLRSEKHTNVAMKAAVATWLHRYAREDMFGTSPISDSEKYAALARHPFVTEASSAVMAAPERSIRLSAMAFVYTVALEHDEPLARRFFALVSTGVGFESSDHPAYLLRKKLIENRTTSRKQRQVYVAAIVVKAWNAFARGQTLRQLKQKPGDVFPQIA